MRVLCVIDIMRARGAPGRTHPTTLSGCGGYGCTLLFKAPRAFNANPTLQRDSVKVHRFVPRSFTLPVFRYRIKSDRMTRAIIFASLKMLPNSRSANIVSLFTFCIDISEGKELSFGVFNLLANCRHCIWAFCVFY